MIKNYLLITFRNMMKNKLFIFINVLEFFKFVIASFTKVIVCWHSYFTVEKTTSELIA